MMATVWYLDQNLSGKCILSLTLETDKLLFSLIIVLKSSETIHLPTASDQA